MLIPADDCNQDSKLEGYLLDSLTVFRSCFINRVITRGAVLTDELKGSILLNWMDAANGMDIMRTYARKVIYTWSGSRFW